MGKVLRFPAKARWALWEAALAAEYMVAFPVADSEERAHLLVVAWQTSPTVAKFGVVEKYALNGLGFKFHVGIPPSPAERKVVFRWLDYIGDKDGN